MKEAAILVKISKGSVEKSLESEENDDLVNLEIDGIVVEREARALMFDKGRDLNRKVSDRVGHVLCFIFVSFAFLSVDETEEEGEIERKETMAEETARNTVGNEERAQSHHP